MKTSFLSLLSAILFLQTSPVLAAQSADDCSDMEVEDVSMGMCRPLPMADMPMKMIMFHYNSFFTETAAQGPRGRNAFTVPNMFMMDAGTSIGDRHYLNLDLMGTLERWTFPTEGYPELLQIGEENEAHKPFLDAQHPHSSPIMGLTLSDTIRLGSGKDYAKMWLAPRGQASDGPIAFMHRPTGMINPDAPLGHHIGQDVGHITSAVVGASLTMSGTTLELSAFNGTEPQPTNVDLPLGPINSYGGRLIQALTPHAKALISAAMVKNPEPHDPDLDHVNRYSASVYSEHVLSSAWNFQNAFIYGLVNFYDNTSALNSFNEEFLFQQEKKNVWGRIERLQRTAGELKIASAVPNDPLWITAVTLGYTHEIAKWDFHEIGLGASLTKNFLPAEFQADYGGEPLSGKIFLQVGGMKMWDL